MRLRLGVTAQVPPPPLQGEERILQDLEAALTADDLHRLLVAVTNDGNNGDD
jgi:hypothetical protein